MEDFEIIILKFKINSINHINHDKFLSFPFSIFNFHGFSVLYDLRNFNEVNINIDNISFLDIFKDFFK